MMDHIDAQRYRRCTSAVSGQGKACGKSPVMFYDTTNGYVNYKCIVCARKYVQAGYDISEFIWLNQKLAMMF